MIIERLKLKNFIGIKHGLGLDEIELDFTQGNKKMIMLSGANGSGKSTIMEQLHPFKDSATDRKNLILDGFDGVKEIDIRNGDDLYEIVHYYSKSPQSFIKKNGEELNENGGVRTCEEIIAKELQITKDYFAIGRISSATKNFVNFTASDRKSYIGTFLNIEDILEKFKIVNDKFKNLKKESSKTAEELEKFNSEEVIVEEINQTKESAKVIDEKLAALYERQGSLATAIERDTQEIGNASLTALSDRITEKEKDISDNSSIKSTLEAEIPNIGNSSSDTQVNLQQEITKTQTDIEVLNSEKQHKLLIITDTKNRISANDIKINSLGNPEDIEKIKNELADVETQKNEKSEKIKNNPLGQFITRLVQNKKDPVRDLNNFIKFTDFIEKYFKELSALNISANKSTIRYFADEKFKESLERLKAESKIAINNDQKLLEEQQKERGILEGYVSQLSNLKQRPEGCNINDCPFIKDAYAHRNVLSEIDELDGKITQTKEDIKKLNLKAEEIQNLESLYLNYHEVLQALPERGNLVFEEFVKDTGLFSIVEGSLSDFQSSRQEFIENCENAISDLNAFLNFNEKYNSMKKSLQMLQDTDFSLRETLTNEKKNCEEKLKSLNTDLDEINTKLSKKLVEVESKQKLNEKYLTYIQASSKLAAATTMLSTSKSEYDRVLKLYTNKTKSENELIEVKNSIADLQNQKENKEKTLTTLNLALEKVKNLKASIDLIQKQYLPLETVSKALDPNKGIPLIMIQTYLSETEAIANDLLNIAFNGEFQIKFYITEKEFSIQVISKNNVKPDIKMASQGEIAITTISLSLALIEQSINKFNILYLDEIDGPLDPTNRSNFIDIIDTQIRKLGIEQVFIISHNNAFDAAELGLVLLRGSKVNIENDIFMKNKTVIYKYE